MGREVRRVAKDFRWPMNKTYEGFVMPEDLHPLDCPACGGGGSSEAGRLLSDRWYGRAPFDPAERGSTPFTPDDPLVRAIVSQKVNRDDETRRFYEGYTGATGDRMVTREAMRMCGIWNASWSHHLSQDDVDALIARGRLSDFTHERKADGSWGPRDPLPSPTARDVNIWSLQGMGQDSINQWTVARAEAERLGVGLECTTCEGTGSAWRDAAHKQAHDDWEPTPPPAGDGWQMWETTSEGSPISPVMDSPEALARWLADSGASAFGGQGASFEHWMAMIGEGWAPSMVMTNGVPMSGVAAVSQTNEGEK